MTASDPAATFRQEARELLDQLEEVLLDLAQRPHDQQLVDSAFRALHTIKGSGAMFGFDTVAAFVHEFEAVFDRVRKGQVAVPSGLVSVALAAKDHIFKLIEHANESGGAEILDRLRAIVGTDAAAPTAGKQAGDAEGELGTWRIRFRLPPDALMSGANPLLLLDELRDFGDCSVTAITDSVPPLEQLDAETCYLGWDVIVSTDRPRDAIDDVFMFLRDDMELEVDPVEGTARLGELLVERGHVSASTVAKTLSQQERIGEMLVDAGVVSRDQVSSALAEQQHLKKQSNREAAEKPGTAQANASVRVPAERLDELMDRVGELVIAQARLNQIASASSDTNLKTVAEELERLVLGLARHHHGHPHSADRDDLRPVPPPDP